MNTKQMETELQNGKLWKFIKTSSKLQWLFFEPFVGFGITVLLFLLMNKSYTYLVDKFGFLRIIQSIAIIVIFMISKIIIELKNVNANLEDIKNGNTKFERN